MDYLNLRLARIWETYSLETSLIPSFWVKAGNVDTKQVSYFQLKALLLL